MNHEMAGVAKAVAVMAGLGTLVGVLLLLDVRGPQAARAERAAAADAPTAEYIGHKRCASCHFEEFMAWRNTKHAKAFENVPKEHYTNRECLSCHITGFGLPGGYTREKPDLLGVTCEACHGPGSRHEEVTKQFEDQEELTDEQRALISGTIQPATMNVCADCHQAVTHGQHPEF